MTHTIKTDQWAWLLLHKPVDNNGHGFVHTYRLMNGRGHPYVTVSAKTCLVRTSMHIEKIEIG